MIFFQKKRKLKNSIKKLYIIQFTTEVLPLYEIRLNIVFEAFPCGLTIIKPNL